MSSSASSVIVVMLSNLSMSSPRGWRRMAYIFSASNKKSFGLDVGAKKGMTRRKGLGGADLRFE